ncbi:3-keto-disaccharide hydrolase [Calycomorphotria hydatis]
MALLCFLTLNGLADAGEWRSLFNGKDLTGWTPKIVGHEAGDNFGDTFRVEDGVIKVSYDHYDKFDRKFGHLFYNEPFSHYRLRIEYRFVGDQAPGGEGWAFRNSGAMLHGQTPESMGLDQDFPDSIEGQFLGGKSDGKKRSTANLCTPGTDVIMDGKLRKKHCTSSSSKTYDGDQWVTVEFEVRGSDSIKHYVNGDLVLEYTKPQLDDGTLLESGTISLQSESHPIEFRKVEIMELDAE